MKSRIQSSNVPGIVRVVHSIRGDAADKLVERDGYSDPVVKSGRTESVVSRVVTGLVEDDPYNYIDICIPGAAEEDLLRDIDQSFNLYPSATILYFQPRIPAHIEFDLP